MHRPQFYWLVLAVLLALCAAALGSTTTLARTNNTITVNSTLGTWNPGDGNCTLREAINNANNDSNVPPTSSPDCAAGNGADVIVLGLGSTFALHQVDSGAAPDTNGMPVITSDITIDGNFSSITRNSNAPNFRIFKVAPTGKLTLNDLVLSSGKVQAEGGGIYNAGTLIVNRTYVGDNQTLEPSTARVGFGGGGIYNGGLLTLNAANIYNNKTGRGATVYTTQYDGYRGGDGGGLYNAANATAEISMTSFSLNQTGIGGNKSPQIGEPHPVDSGIGGALYNEGLVSIVRGEISGNLSGVQDGLTNCVCYSRGGGIAISNGAVTITDSRIANNGAQRGGGIYVALGDAYIYRTLFQGNRGVEGAALMTDWNGTIAESGSIFVLNSTFTGNAADWQQDTDLSSPRSIVSNLGNTSIDYSTIADNTVLNQGQLPVGIGNRISVGSLALWNTIVSNTINVPNCYNHVNLPITNLGHNIDSGDSCGFGTNNNSASNIDPKLAALADNGGPTWTRAIAADSAARDQGNTAECLYASSINNVDQRGYPRIAGTNNSCDIGAYEYGASAPVIEPTVTNTPTLTPTNVPPGPTSTPTLTPTSIPPGPTSTPPACAEMPNAPVLTAPGNNTTVTAARVQLKWKAATCATTYNVTVKLKNKVVEAANGLTTAKFKTKALAGGKYTWFVQACNATGCTTSLQFKFNR